MSELPELSPYAGLRPRHLHGFFRSVRGEFRLIPLPGGGTRLKGRTWYTVNIHPAGYWRWICDRILHAIHRRVLQHIRRQVEAGP